MFRANYTARLKIAEWKWIRLVIDDARVHYNITVYITYGCNERDVNGPNTNPSRTERKKKENELMAVERVVIVCLVVVWCAV